MKQWHRCWQKTIGDSKMFVTKLEYNPLLLLRIIKSNFRLLRSFHFALKIEVRVLLCARIIGQRAQGIRKSTGVFSKSTGHGYYFFINKSI